MFDTKASRDKEPRSFEQINARVSRDIADESIVLLKNDGILPLAPGTSLALYGEGAACTIKGGVGSGEVNVRYTVTIWEGLEKAGFPILTEKWLSDYQKLADEKHAAYLERMRKKAGFLNFNVIHELLSEPFSNPEGMLIDGQYLVGGTDICLYVLSRQAGEEMDRKPIKGDFLLTDSEITNIRICTENYAHVILIINAGGCLDLTPLEKMNLSAVIFFCQQGSEGGNALADVVSGRVVPSGHLAFTWPKKYADVPFGDQFSTLNGNTEYEEYREGIYVGYRYYDSFSVEPRWPFGYGLSYTSFSEKANIHLNGSRIAAEVEVKNTGKMPGKDVLQLYVSCPSGKLDKEYQRLAAFAKTGLLMPGEKQTVELSFILEDLASYDEKRDCFILEPGYYLLRLGESSRETVLAAALSLKEEVIVSRHSAVCPVQHKFEELHASPHGESIPPELPILDIDRSAIETKTYSYSMPPQQMTDAVRKEMKKIHPSQLHQFCVGAGLDIALPKHRSFIVPGACGYTTDIKEHSGIPSLVFSDGPAGLRLFDECVITGSTVRMTHPVMESFDILPFLARYLMIKKPKEGKMLYQYATAFPVGMALAQTWNIKAGEAYGEAIQREMESFGVDFWLAPGMNLQRNPLCGRNYEYYSEDPVLSGFMAASVCHGVQSKPGFAATIKHFCCNNQEMNRNHISENVSQRALRELYLNNFRIALREGHPHGIMTSYNKVNGIYSSENYDLLTKVLRCEWDFQGLVMTDWITDQYLLNSAKAMEAGVDLMMPGIRSDHIQIQKAQKAGILHEETICRRTADVLYAITQSRRYQENKKGTI